MNAASIFLPTQTEEVTLHRVALPLTFKMSSASTFAVRWFLAQQSINTGGES